MKSRRIGARLLILLAAWAVFAASAGTASAQSGAYLHGAGAINRSMAGASTAAPLSAAGALYWNPATLSGLPRSELEAGAELLFVHSSVESSIAPGSLAPGFPPVNLAGRTSSDTGVAPLPTIGLAIVPEDSPLSYGLGIFAVAGFGVDYAGTATNPALSARPPVGVGFGPIYSNLDVLQVAPAVSLQVTDRISVGVGPTLNLARLRIDPFLLASPDNGNGDPFYTYPPGSHDSTTWGAGFDVGAYYRGDEWSFGASYRSPQWFDTFTLNSQDEAGRARRLRYGLDLPAIISLGTAYTGLERWLFAADVRYFNYSGAKGIGDGGYQADGAARGPGWNSIFSVALGTQYQWSDALSLRAGYCWNQNPAPDSEATINIVSPAIIEHTVSVGASLALTSDLSASFAYLHGFENSMAGPINVFPRGAIPGSSVVNSASFDSVVASLNLKFGGPKP